MTKHKGLWFAVQATVTVALLLALFRNFDFAAFLALVARVPLSFYLASLGALFACQLLYALKWHLVLRTVGVNVRFWRVTEQYLIGLFFNNFLPTTVGGDVARVYYLGREEGYASVGASVLLDRALGFWSLTVWATALVWSFDASTQGFAVARQALTALLVVFVGAVLALVLLPLGSLMARVATIRWIGPVARALETLRMHGSPILRSPGTVAGVMTIVLGYVAVVTAIYTAYFRVVAGLAPPFVPVMAVLLAIGILSNVPITVNGIGLREQLHYLLFAGLGIGKEPAVGIALIVFSQLLILSLVGCALWLRMRVSYSLTRAAPAR